jgi:hypothetical protein
MFAFIRSVTNDSSTWHFIIPGVPRVTKELDGHETAPVIIIIIIYLTAIGL